VSGNFSPGRIAQSVVRFYRGIPAPIRVLSAGALINRAGGFVSAFLALILALRGISAPDIGVALAISGGFMIAGAWVGGALTSRLGSKRVIVAAMIGSALFTAALVPASPFPLTVGIVCLIALCNRAYIPAASTMVGRLSPPGQRLQMFSVFQLTFNIGVAVGSALAGYLLTHSLTVLLLIDAATSICFALAALRLPADLQPSRPAGERAAHGQARKKVRNDARYLMFLAGAALVALTYTQYYGPVPLAFRSHHYNLELLGYFFGANAIAVIVFQLPLSYITRRFPVQVPLVLGAILIGGGYLVLLAGFTVPLLIASVALWTAGEIVYAPTAPTVAVQMSTSRSHGSYQGALDVARSAGQAFGPSLGIFAYSAGTSVPWWGCGAAGLVATCLFFTAVRSGRSQPHGGESTERLMDGVEQVAEGT
jgi:predicted MFS family arabinose efflux permease